VLWSPFSTVKEKGEELEQHCVHEILKTLQKKKDSCVQSMNLEKQFKLSQVTTTLLEVQLTGRANSLFRMSQVNLTSWILQQTLTTSTSSY